MKAIVMSDFGGPEQLVFREVDEPIGRNGWVTVDLRASALNWHDVLVRRGQYRSPLPHTPGADGAGVRTDTGEEVVILPSLFWGDRHDAPAADFEILGDHVPGTYAERVCVPEQCLAPKPAGYSWEEAAALPLVGVTSYRALVTRAGLSAGESLLIIGAGGGVATMALSLATALGAQAFVTASSEEKLARARNSGAAGGVLHSREDWPQQAKALSPDGNGFDVILDPVGLWDRSVEALRPGGRVVVLGANVAEHVTMDVRRFFFGQYSLLGTTMGGLGDFRGLLNLVATGAVAAPTIAATYSLDDAAQAHRHLEAGDAIGKIVLTP
ncbi:oxidoreductase [Nocardia sp. 852002-20019_SCH5090214]|uniref:quinone oxidoreductase family protein n=1 Tax=Nocardia sp. 852002-20019_SCH5090214 TaxID=1834087 RepID=UPI0007EB886C|nr:zinc-binding dehydrogenase [Nocardia sp. 852002-20019_SCH5090214]OBA58336.1 oxidoreductase [Nocardia sp. 852002-20019_SCH5090214]